MTHRIALFVLSLALFGVPSEVAAQVERGDPVPLSQYAEVEQAVAWGSIHLEYRRPVARGRELFGSLIPWDSVWTPAADSAAVLTTTAPLEIAGQALDAGSYSLWFVPRASGSWTLVLSDEARVFHAPYPGAGSDALRVDLDVEVGEYVESVLFQFPWAEGTETLLQFRWGDTVVPIPIEVR